MEKTMKENLNVKDLLPYLKEIANEKKPNFGEIVSKFGKNGFKEIEKLLSSKGFGEEDEVGGGDGIIAKAGLGFIQKFD
uniref:Uncharacterized protein n=1 Tax=Panagrolaimus sp. ES5 TaxID=591445 RepID=A0AC34F5V4_9BILA